MLAASGISALGGIFGANSAADAQKRAADQSAETQRRAFMAQLGMYEPQRNVGYQALGDLSSLYGYSMPAYSTPGDLGRTMTPLGSRQIKQMLDRGTSLEDVMKMGTLGGQLTGKGLKRLQRAGLSAEDIARLQGIGQTAAPTAPGAPGATQGPAGNFDRFFTSPDYQFRKEQGMQGLEQSAAARGGAFSGDAHKSLTEFNSNLASGEFGNYFNRVSQMAGLGSAATNNVAQAGTVAANNIGNAQMAAGDARASGIMGGVNTAGNAINSGLNNYMLWKYLQPGLGSSGPSAGGYGRGI
jgi:hypothetical protein